MGHLVIAGTGRAGTSFLVRWLDACGLDVGTGLTFFAGANAGLERSLLGENLPYVVKDPWLWTYCDQVDPELVDVLVVPMRDLTHAAESRVRQELASGSHHGGYVGYTAGGMVVPASATDQARTLAVGFHELVWWAVRNEVPLVFFEYPRMVDDVEYASARLASMLGPPYFFHDYPTDQQWYNAIEQAHGRVADQPFHGLEP